MKLASEGARQQNRISNVLLRLAGVNVDHVSHNIDSWVRMPESLHRKNRQMKDIQVGVPKGSNLEPDF